MLHQHIAPLHGCLSRMHCDATHCRLARSQILFSNYFEINSLIYFVYMIKRMYIFQHMRLCAQRIGLIIITSWNIFPRLKKSQVFRVYSLTWYNRKKGYFYALSKLVS
jgi:hypothetical protein